MRSRPSSAPGNSLSLKSSPHLLYEGLGKAYLWFAVCLPFTVSLWLIISVVLELFIGQDTSPLLVQWRLEERKRWIPGTSWSNVETGAVPADHYLQPAHRALWSECPSEEDWHFRHFPVCMDKLTKLQTTSFSPAKNMLKGQRTWPYVADLATKLWGSAEDLYQTAGFVASTRLKIWPARLSITEEEEEGAVQAR